MPITTITGVSGDEQMCSYQNGTLSVTRAGFAVTLELALSQDAILDAATTEDEVAERAQQLLEGTGLNATVYIGQD